MRTGSSATSAFYDRWAAFMKERQIDFATFENLHDLAFKFLESEELNPKLFEVTVIKSGKSGLHYEVKITPTVTLPYFQAEWDNSWNP